MVVIIKNIRKKSSVISKFVNKEWNKFNKERDYKYNEKKFELVALNKGVILGYASFKINGGVSYLSQLIVSKDMRSKGIGEKLINKFENISKKHKCHLIYLETSERHKEAIKFYKKHGYKIIARFPDNKFHFTWFFFSKRL